MLGKVSGVSSKEQEFVKFFDFWDYMIWDIICFLKLPATDLMKSRVVFENDISIYKMNSCSLVSLKLETDFGLVLFVEV